MNGSGRENLAIEEPRLVICEGASDKAFLQNLLRQHALTGFQVEHPREETTGAGGFDAIGRLLSAFSVHRKWKELRGLSVVVDADTDPARRFRQV